MLSNNNKLLFSGVPKALCLMCVHYRGGCSVPWEFHDKCGRYLEYHGGYHEYRGGYLEHLRGFSVP